MDWLMYFIPCKAQSSNNVSRSMSLREHIFNLIAGINIPLFNAYRLHCLLIRRKLLRRFTLTGIFHNLKAILLFKRWFLTRFSFILFSLMEKIGHNIITASYNLGNRARTVLNKLLSITEPNVCAVGKTRNLQKVGKCFRLSLKKHTDNKRRTHFRNCKSTCLAIYILRRNTDRLGRCDKLIQKRIWQINIHNGNTRWIFKIFIKSRIIVPKLVKLQKCIVKRVFKVKVGCVCTLRFVIWRILNRGEILNGVFIGNNNHTARVLTCCSLNARTTDRQSVNLSSRSNVLNTTLVKIFHNIAISGFIGNCCHSTCFEHIFLTEKFLCKSVRTGLILAGEVKVNIRFLIAVKAKEGFKWNFVAVTLHRSAAIRAILDREVKTRTVFAV